MSSIGFSLYILVLKRQKLILLPDFFPIHKQKAATSVKLIRIINANIFITGVYYNAKLITNMENDEKNKCMTNIPLLCQ